MGQSTIDDTHGELGVEVGKRSDSSHKEVDVVLFSIEGQKSLNCDNFDFVLELRSDFLQ